MGAAVHDDVALPPLALVQVVVHRDAVGHLHDAAKAAAEQAAKVGQPPVQAAVANPLSSGPSLRLKRTKMPAWSRGGGSENRPARARMLYGRERSAGLAAAAPTPMR
jgi:hypothetical protein